MPFNETTAYGLYDSAVRAFPRTTKRQHITDDIKITRMEWTPYLGVRTLYIKGLAQNTENGKEYHPQVLFKDVQYSPVKHRGMVEIIANDNKSYIFEKLEYDGNDMLVRCDCLDFSYRFNYYDHLDHSLYGRKRAEYIGGGGPPANPLELPGMCKHLMKFIKALDHAGIIE